MRMIAGCSSFEMMESDAPVNNMRSRSLRFGQRARSRSTSAARIASARRVSALTAGDGDLRAIPLPVSLAVLGDDLLDERTRGAALLDVRGDGGGQRIDVGDADVRDRGDLGIDVARHGDVDEEERALGARAHRLGDVVDGDDEARRAGRGEHDVGLAQSVNERRQLAHASGAQTAHDVVRALDGTVDDDELARAFEHESPRGGLAHLPGADDEHAGAGDRAQTSLGQIDRRRRDADELSSDRRLRARGFPGAQRLAEEGVQRLAERSGALGLHVGVLDLPEDLGFADEHRVQARRDAEEVPDRLAAQQGVEVRAQVLDAGVAEALEKAPQLRGAAFELVDLGVDLETSAGLQHRRFPDRLVVAQRDEGLGHLRGGKGVAFADVDRSGPVRHAKTDYRHGYPARA